MDGKLNLEYNNSFLKSRYNVYLPRNYIFNTWSGALIQLDTNEYDNLLNDKYDILNIKLIDKLMLTKIITRSVDEFSCVCEENSRFLKNNNKFSIVIAPTSKCNARCEYCFEKGIKAIDMDDSTRGNLINFIENNGRGKDVHITWFGGEPLMGADIITLICNSLKERNIKFTSSMISNGFLFDKFIDEVKNKWNLTRVQVTLDEIKEKYDSIKKIGYGSFDKIVANIHLLLKAHINVTIRVNFDSKNYKDSLHLIEYVKNEFGNEVGLYFHDIIGEGYLSPNEIKPNPMIEISEKLIHYGFVKTLPDLKIKRTMTPCGLEKEDFINVFPDGGTTRCEHFIGQESEYSAGNINEPDFKPTNYIKKMYRNCSKCICFPICGGGCDSNHKIGDGYGCTRIKTGLNKILEIYIKEIIERESTNS